MQVIGASVDPVKANAKFAQRYDLAFPLLCDTDYAVASAFGVARPMVGVAKRTTFLIDTDGTLRKVYPQGAGEGSRRRGARGGP